MDSSILPVVRLGPWICVLGEGVGGQLVQCVYVSGGGGGVSLMWLRLKPLTGDE